MTKAKIILNPQAGHGTALNSLPKIEAALGGNGLTYDIVRTERPLHAIELAKEAVKEGVDLVISAGGDGTANEVLNGLMQSKEEGEGKIPAMGVICVGRGNDFAYSMGIPEDLDENLAVLVAGHKKYIDVGYVEGGDFPDGRFFGNCIGIGFDAQAGFVAVKLKPLSGLLNYLVAAILTDFFYYKAPKVLLAYDGTEMEMKTLMVSIMNGTRLGGGFYMTPNSKPDDGVFDICIADAPGPLRVLGLIPHFLNGTQEGEEEIRIVRAKEVQIKAIEGVLPAHLDGETLCEEGEAVDVKILPKQIEIICRSE